MLRCERGINDGGAQDADGTGVVSAGGVRGSRVSQIALDAALEGDTGAIDEMVGDEGREGEREELRVRWS